MAEQRERQARKALLIAVVCLFASPAVLAGLAASTIHWFGVFGSQPLEVVFVLLIAMGALVGLPGIVLGLRALKAPPPGLSADPAAMACLVRARRAGRLSVAIGIVTSLAGAVLHPLFVVLGGMGAPGRPFRRRGRPQKAGLSSDRAWCGAPPSLPCLPPREQSVRARRWTEAARAEHASVAAFCRTVLDLLALGSPPELVERALLAALDEVSHARLSFALASAYAGAPVSAGPMPAAADGRAPGHIALAVASLADGWANEGLASVRAADDASRAEPGFERDALATIAEDEARHSRLGRDLAAWALAAR